ncbi:hypothetical protein HWV62_20858 [Athelia sp. TMB]|nr:hypothetical protein HWV62_20858 [Athelia sp. TMB]
MSCILSLQTIPNIPLEGWRPMIKYESEVDRKSPTPAFDADHIADQRYGVAMLCVMIWTDNYFRQLPRNKQSWSDTPHGTQSEEDETSLTRDKSYEGSFRSGEASPARGNSREGSFGGGGASLARGKSREGSFRIATRERDSRSLSPPRRVHFSTRQVALPKVGLKTDKAIRCHTDRTVWYPSKGDIPLDIDTLAQLELKPQPNSGDLFIYICGDDIQAFLFTGRHSQKKWVTVCSGHRHPYLGTHRLFVYPDGTPTWVKANTISSYKGPARRKAREA